MNTYPGPPKNQKLNPKYGTIATLNAVKLLAVMVEVPRSNPTVIA